MGEQRNIGRCRRWHSVHGQSCEGICAHDTYMSLRTRFTAQAEQSSHDTHLRPRRLLHLPSCSPARSRASGPPAPLLQAPCVKARTPVSTFLRRARPGSALAWRVSTAMKKRNQGWMTIGLAEGLQATTALSRSWWKKKNTSQPQDRGLGCLV